MTAEHTTIAIMGDLVGSERVASRERLHAEFNAAIDAANRTMAAGLVSPLTITLGDEFQGLTSTFHSAVTLVQKLRLTLLSVDVECRFAVGLTQLRAPINREKAWNMMGDGLAETREKLNEKAENPYRFFLGSNRWMIAVLMEAVGRSLSQAESGWTDRQRQVVVSLAAGESPKEVSKRLGVHIRTLYKVREAAQYDYYMAQWASLIDIAKHLDLEHGLA